MIFFFGVIFIAMITITARASLEMPIWQAFDTFGAHPWAVATLWDAYFGFLTFYVWVAWKETRWSGRMLWFLLVMALGNISMSLYVLLELRKMPKDAPLAWVLTSRNE